MTLSTLRFVIVVALLLVVLQLRRTALPRDPRLCAHLVVSGTLIHGGFIGGVFIGIDIGIDIGIAALIAGAQPLLTALIVVPLLGENLSGRQWSGFLIGFCGLVLVVVKGFSADALSLAAMLWCVVALGGITFGTLYQKRYVTGVDLFAGSTIQFSAAAVVCGFAALATETRIVEWRVPLVLALVWLCVVMSLGAVTILMYLIREGAASKVSSLFYLVPPVTALQGYILFNERLSAIQLLGIAVTAAGVAMINVQNSDTSR